MLRYCYDRHASVLTGAGFATAKIGFISYRCCEDAGPDIWWTRDSGDGWEKLHVTVPKQHSGEGYRFTPGTPVFDGPSGVYPITVLDRANGGDAETTIYMRGSDYGLTWEFRS